MAPRIILLASAQVVAASSESLLAYAGLRAELWPEADAPAHAADFLALLRGPVPYAGLLALAAESGEPCAFAEVSHRALGANGCDTRPVAFLEGLYVRAPYRRRGIARSLIGEVERWAQSRGCAELGSDALIDNDIGRAAHRALGFEEIERVVCFRRRLA